MWSVMGESRNIELSVVVPVYNEEANLPILVPKLVEVFDRLGFLYEMIFVDDGSSDGSRRLLKEMASRVSSLRWVGLKQKRGLSTALLAGMREARGKIIVTLDSGLQNDPEEIPRLLGYLDRYDMVTGWRQKREDPWLKRIASRIANSVRNRLSGERIND